MRGVGTTAAPHQKATSMTPALPGRSFDRALSRHARRLNPALDGSRWCRRLLYPLTVVTSLAVVLLAFASIANAGKITPSGDCSNAPTVSWRPDGTGEGLTVSLSGPAGTITGLPAAGSSAAAWASTYIATWYKGDIPWGSSTATTPAAPVCASSTSVAAPVPTPAPELALDIVATGEPTATTGPVIVVTGETATTAAIVTGGGELPATGAWTDRLILAGAITLGAGIAVMICRGGRPDPSPGS